MLRLVGRDDETARLGALLAGLAGEPSALVVEGPPAGSADALLRWRRPPWRGAHVAGHNARWGHRRQAQT